MWVTQEGHSVLCLVQGVPRRTPTRSQNYGEGEKFIFETGTSWCSNECENEDDQAESDREERRSCRRGAIRARTYYDAPADMAVV